MDLFRVDPPAANFREKKMRNKKGLEFKMATVEQGNLIPARSDSSESQSLTVKASLATLTKPETEVVLRTGVVVRTLLVSEFL
ncbi:hypothetical protein Mal48_27420 [Thalassoglobus polymorphus]|uniref:Uncharacterized protein n=1 Tax=Thalassoglobus polymorphus TaxID=2527994 RepID=A0A517QPC5_9PLAN|nr:hypothetical protein Mal48_27420 [Thalassoglobus polymorphus]